MQNAISIFILLFTLCALNAQKKTELFPAKTKQWKQAGPGNFSIDKGIATSQGGMGLWWYAGKSYKNATFDIEFRLPDHQWNSGIFVRFPDPKNDPWVAVRKGYECQVSGDGINKLDTGAIYDIQAPSAKSLKKPGDWNHYQITTFENYIIIIINGKLVNVYTTQAGRGDQEGHIGLQNHDPISKVDYRKVTVTEWNNEVPLKEVLKHLKISRKDWVHYTSSRSLVPKWYKKMDIGPAWANVFCDHYQGTNRATTKGVKLELSQIDSIYGLFDSETMRLSSAYQGGLTWGGTPWTGGHGSLVTLNNDELSIMETSQLAGWANASGAFTDTRKIPGHGNFAKNHMRYNGYFRNGSQVILDYSVLGSRVLETISGTEKMNQAMAFRQLELAPSDKKRSMLVSDRLGADVTISNDRKSAVLRQKVLEKILPTPLPKKVSVLIDHTKGDWATLSMGAPSSEDLVDRSKNKNTYFRVVPGYSKTHARGGDEEGVAVRLNDGLTTINSNDVKRSFFFEDNPKQGRLEMNFGKLTNIKRMHLYSEHLKERAGQHVDIYYSDKKSADPTLPEDKLKAGGWKKLTSYNTSNIKKYGKIGVAVLSPKGSILGSMEKALFICRPPSDKRSHTFFSEIDIYADKAPALGYTAMDVSLPSYAVQVKGENARLRNAGNGTVVLDIAPSTKQTQLSIAYTSHRKKITPTHQKILSQHIPEPRELQTLIKGGKALFPETVITKGELSKEKSTWLTDSITLPLKNPWFARIRPGGFDFFPGGDSAALSTWEGDVWVVTGLNGDLSELKWRRYASGLFETLGLKIVDGLVYVHGRDQITRLHDQNKDGEADWYECFNNDVIVTKNFHEFAFSLQTDKQGNFYIAKGAPVLAGGRGFDEILPHNGCIMKVSKDGEKLEVIATGLRAPGAITVGPNGEITTGENEGTWQPCCKLNYFTGKDKFLGTEPTAQYLKGQKMTLPLCYFPLYIDNSGGGQVWLPKESNWGLQSGELIHLSYGKSSLYRVLKETVGGQIQGGVVRIPVQLGSSAMRARFHPDKSLYVLGFRGWQTNAAKPQAFERIRYNGGKIDLPDQLNVTDKGIYIRFEQELDPATVADRFNFNVERWKYIRSKQYGSGEYSIDNPDLKAEKLALTQESRGTKHDQVNIVSTTLLSDKKTVFLYIPSMKPAEQMSIKYKLQFADKRKVEGEIVNTVHKLSPHTQPELLKGKATTEISKNLKSGLEQTITSAGGIDHRISRLPAQFVAKNDHISDMLPRSTKENHQWTSTWSGYLVLRKRIKPQFALQGNTEGKGKAVLKINGKEILKLDGDLDIKTLSESIQLDPGTHRFELSYTSQKSGEGQIRTLWKSEDVPLQSIPPMYFKHQSNSSLEKALEIRAGRDIMHQQNCMKCHSEEKETKLSSYPLTPELDNYGPSLKGIGNRVNAPWLAQWLANPHHLKPDTTMPAFVDPTTKQGKIDAANMAAYLASLKVEKTTPAVEPSVADIKQGGDSFNRLGCVACHSMPNVKYDSATKRIPLNNINKKFDPTHLALFLKKPDRHHASIKMPDFKLSDTEAKQLAAFLHDQSKGKENKALELPTKGNLTRGKHLVTQHHCSACHDGLPKGSTSQPSLTEIIAKDWSKYTKAKKHPKLNLTAKQLVQLESYRTHLKSKKKLTAHSTPLSLHDFTHRQYDALNCAACHSRDGSTATLDTLHKESHSLSEGMPIDDRQKVDQSRPQMTYIGEMLHTDYMEKMLDGKVKSPRPWLRMRMPAFHSRAGLLARGLAAQQGMAPSSLDTLDKKANEKLDPNEVEIGKKLIGSDGGFACTICHANGETKALAAFEVEGVNFAKVAERLRPGYYHKWMENPQSITPSTKMPRYTTGGKSPFPDHNNDAKKQMDSILEYLKSMDKKEK